MLHKTKKMNEFGNMSQKSKTRQHLDSFVLLSAIAVLAESQTNVLIKNLESDQFKTETRASKNASAPETSDLETKTNLEYNNTNASMILLFISK